jgi:hypothetical protein
MDVDVDEIAASLTFTAAPSPQHLMGLLLASPRPEAQNLVHDHVQVDAVRAPTARPIALS